MECGVVYETFWGGQTFWCSRGGKEVHLGRSFTIHEELLEVLHCSRAVLFWVERAWLRRSFIEVIGHFS